MEVKEIEGEMMGIKQGNLGMSLQTLVEGWELIM